MTKPHSKQGLSRNPAWPASKLGRNDSRAGSLDFLRLAVSNVREHPTGTDAPPSGSSNKRPQLPSWGRFSRVTAWLSPINIPSPLLNLISEAVKHRGEPVVSSLLSQLATPLYLPLKPDQRFERVCFHGSRPREEKPRPMGIKGRGQSRVAASEKAAWGKSYQEANHPDQLSASSMLSVQPAWAPGRRDRTLVFS
jgi:hypothetical protein